LKKKKILKNYYQDISFILFIILIILVPLGFWKDFDNGFDLVKSSILRIEGGIFIITCSIYLIIRKSKMPGSPGLQIEKTFDPLMFFFLISVILSTVFSYNTYLSFFGNYETQIGLIAYLYLFVIYFILPEIINDEKKFRQTFLVIESVALIIAIFSIIEYFGQNPFNLKPTDFTRPVSPVGHPVFTAGFMVLILPFSAVNISGKKSFLFKIFVPLVIFLGIIATQTRSAYAAAAIQIIILSVLYPFVFKPGKLTSKKHIIYSVVFLLLVILFTVFFIKAFPENAFVKRFLSISSITHMPRWFLWQDSINMFFHHPVTGTGISAFSNVFENYASYELKYAEIIGFYINAHSNFLNTFCTMGLIGGIAYLLVLLKVLRISFKNIFSRDNNTAEKFFFFSSIAAISGYMVYGLADFDDINILLYLFVILSLFKIKYLKANESKRNNKNIVFNKKTKVVIGILLIMFSIYNIYSACIDVSAQAIFSNGRKKYNSGDINAYIEGMNSVEELKPGESYYRYKFAYDILVYSSVLKKNNAETKKALLERAKEEVIKAEKNYRSLLECLALKSLIELELGNETEGLKLKDEIFKSDTIQFPYRTNLAVYFLNHNNDSAAIYEINSILNWDIKNTRVMTLKVYYLERKGLMEEAIEICKKILEIEPGNKFAIQTMERLKRE
jgi:O-antigen ligase